MVTVRSLCFKDCKGVSLLETIISLGIFSISSVFIFNQLSFQTNLAKKLSSQISNEQKLKVIQKYLAKIADNQNSFIFSNLHRINETGKISFTDGSLNPIHQSKTLPPSPASQSLSTALINFSQILKITDISVSTQTVNLSTCYVRNESNPSLSEIRSFLAITPDGEVELKGKLTRKNKNCFEGILQKTTSMVFPQSEFISAKYLLPINSIFTLYVSKDKELRYLGHTGDENIENQPIIRGISTMDFAQQNNLKQEKLVALIKFNDSKKRRLVVDFNISTSLFINSLLLPLGEQ